MKQEQFERLQALHEKLVDVFLDEADPDKWPGQGIALASMDAQTRGDRYWSKKNAVATIALTQRIQTLVTVVRVQTSGDDPENPAAVVDPQDDLDRQVADAEREASQLLANLQRPGAKAAFDKRVHGKA
ncbi:hypothetical protein J2W30_003609 [Variovorax boronicumulans]|uniref:hypothetical protein n=1 Tax=Variovorax boronicumulans TaxID=436515 RepID=UPI0027886EDF|nr:hypothetical protein [Variovorax boronicumulans]MDQ0035841.1 hypothetical protein [Variovorax boronicumulans]